MKTNINELIVGSSLRKRGGERQGGRRLMFSSVYTPVMRKSSSTRIISGHFVALDMRLSQWARPEVPFEGNEMSDSDGIQDFFCLQTLGLNAAVL